MSQQNDGQFDIRSLVTQVSQMSTSATTTTTHLSINSIRKLDSTPITPTGPLTCNDGTSSACVTPHPSHHNSSFNEHDDAYDDLHMSSSTICEDTDIVVIDGVEAITTVSNITTTTTSTNSSQLSSTAPIQSTNTQSSRSSKSLLLFFLKPFMACFSEKSVESHDDKFTAVIDVEAEDVLYTQQKYGTITSTTTTTTTSSTTSNDHDNESNTSGQKQKSKKKKRKKSRIHRDHSTSSHPRASLPSAVNVGATYPQQQQQLQPVSHQRESLTVVQPYYYQQVPTHQQTNEEEEVEEQSEYYYNNNYRHKQHKHKKNKFKPLLPPQLPRLHGKKTLVLDLDETLVHSKFEPVEGADFEIPIDIENRQHVVFVMKRPGVDEFLFEMAKHFEIVIFTASLSKYANPLLDRLDIHNVITDRLFREHCTHIDQCYVKDLARLGRDVNQCLIIDNSPTCYAFQPSNAMPCMSWFDDHSDTELIDMIPWLIKLSQENSVYETLEEWRLFIS